jgi:hypothetical protein
VVAQIRGDRARSLTMLGAIVVATAAFTVLTGAVDTSRVIATRRVAQLGPSSYDILVRPKGSSDATEAASGQVRTDFLSGQFGGITTAQYQQISRLSGVAVAAPVAMIGFTLQGVLMSVRLPAESGTAERRLLSVNVDTTTDRGLSHIPSPPSYLYFTKRPLVGLPTPGDPVREREPNGTLVPVCAGGHPTYTDPYDARARSNDQCNRVPGPRTVPLDVSIPLLIEAIDPVQEAKLDQLDGAVVAGRYLTSHDGPGTTTIDSVPFGTFPVLVSNHNYLDDTYNVTVRQLPQSAADGVLTRRLGRTDSTARGTGPVVASQTITMDDAYARLVAQMRHQINQNFFGPVDGLWRVGPANYGPAAANQSLRPTPTTNPSSVWTSKFQYSGYVNTPADNQDTGYRRLAEHVASSADLSTSLPEPDAVGVFDPTKLAPFNPLTHVPLGGYEPPQATPADAPSRALLHGQPLLPNSNLAGYLGQPPQLITTLDALPALENTDAYSGDLSESAPISAIRIRVAGVHGIDALSRARVNLVAQHIIDGTGLQVDITAGSSPSTRSTELPAGQFGRPALTINEGWVRKGVALQILHAVDRKSLVLLVLILFVCGLFVLNATSAAVHSRRRQMGLLACIGWSRRQLFGSILAEQAIRGLLAGCLGVGAAVPIAGATGLHVTWQRSVAAAGAAVVLTMLAGVVPALSASRVAPAQALRPRAGRFAGHRAVRSRLGLAARNLVRTPARSLTAVGGLAFGSCSTLLLLAVTTSFHGEVAGDLLGNAVIIKVHSVDYAAVFVMLAIALFGVADVLYLGIRERASELATLRATGWSRREIDGLIVVEGALLGFVGTLLGAVGSVVLDALFTSAPRGAALVLAAVSVVAGTVLGAVVAIAPTRALPRRLAAALAEE